MVVARRLQALAILWGYPLEERCRRVSLETLHELAHRHMHRRPNDEVQVMIHHAEGMQQRTVEQTSLREE